VVYDRTEVKAESTEEQSDADINEDAQIIMPPTTYGRN
jgi:hypothetical protein